MIKEYDRVKKELLYKFLKQEENLFRAEKIFIAVSVLNWIFDQNPNQFLYEKYMGYIGKFLYNEIDLYWEGNTIKFKAIRDKNDS